MKSTCLTVATLLCLFFACFQISACKKIEKQIYDDPCSDAKFCNIQSYIYPGTPHGLDQDTAIFSYDGYGNPVSVINSFISTGATNAVFKYDALHRLTEFIRPYSNGGFETWSKYFYDASGKIAFDTTYLFGQVSPSGPTDYREARLTNYTYDGTCRIIKTSYVNTGGTSQAGGDPIVNTYSYDASGNLVRAGITYDNKLNIHRTNKVFMFVDRDYSINNPFTAVSYNSSGLPKVISGTAPLNRHFLFRPIENATFRYACD